MIIRKLRKPVPARHALRNQRRILLVAIGVAALLVGLALYFW
jgi:hypothetical protein